ncbi:pimeloyl-ACP methyl esterase BioG family protein [Phaeobacter inhibens]|uniref:pimeloyl-ACP methyl esterase BioG family protein n=1 Tax=Phaeobacter inhibens TaxID=221822 RepID=UPI0024922134|nr:pimeloyl-ACP methyl esterase BioG family protein [Phaeobacter inhibens]
MEVRWLKRKQAGEAIVIFGGWAVGPGVFDHLAGAQDLVFVNDYRNLDADLPDLSGYDHVTLLAWSFGVAAYAHWQEGRADPFDRKVAVNGTLTPVDETRGIPPAVMVKTAEGLSEQRFAQFLRRTFNAPQLPHAVDIDARRAELHAVAARGTASVVAFDQVWIAGRDRIFPPENQHRAWAGATIRELPAAAHVPFDHFDSWQALIS